MPDSNFNYGGFFGGIGGGFLKGGFGLIGAYQQYKYSKELAAQQNQYNIEMWERQAEYNSPTAQMARLSEAGLNPNLVYGGVNPGNMSSAPQMVTPNAPNIQQAMTDAAKALNPEQIISFAINTKKGIAEAHAAEELARKAGAEADLKEAEAQAMAVGNENQFYYFNPSTGQMELSPGNNVSVQRWADNPYRKGMNIHQASIAKALGMRNEYFKTLNYANQMAFRNKQGELVHERIGLTKADAERIGLLNDWYTYNEILKGVNAGAHLIGSFSSIFNLIGRARGLFKNPQKKGVRTIGTDSTGRDWSTTTYYDY